MLTPQLIELIIIIIHEQFFFFSFFFLYLVRKSKCIQSKSWKMKSQLPRNYTYKKNPNEGIMSG